MGKEDCACVKRGLTEGQMCLPKEALSSLFDQTFNSLYPTQFMLHTGGWLLLRAARPIAEGTELTTCHIGAGRFQHVASRRSQLQRE
eukprot:scaffold129762_cov18-Tisochrysis_lutea.AAC.1